MMRVFLSLVLAAVPFTCVAETLQPSSLAKSESVVIDYVHDEDRSGYRRMYEISGADPTTMKIFECYRYGYGEDTRGKAPNKEFLGELVLKNDDVAGLDKLVEFYRLKVWGDSTTSDRIRIEYRRDGKTIGIEEFFDQSGVTTVAEGFRQEGDEFLRQNSRGVNIELMKTLAPLCRFDNYLHEKEKSAPRALSSPKSP